MRKTTGVTNALPFAGHGLRERLLRVVGAGDLYDRLIEQTSQRAAAEAAQAEVSARLSRDAQAQVAEREALQTFAADLRIERDQLAARLQDREAKLLHFEGLSSANRLIELDFPIQPKVRHGWSKPTEPRLTSLIGAGHDRYAGRIKSFLPVIETMAKIKPHPENPGQPHWINDWLPMFDSLSIYAQLALNNPPLYLEIGSGTSTKFARRAVRDFGLRTKIVSIDPYPRSEVDAICDEVIRLPLEQAPAEAYSMVDAHTIMFFDGSHRSFQNSDVTVFFTEILPALPVGMQVGIHDIFLPYDYPEVWLKRHYNEQYLLACWLLAGDKIQIELPVHYCSVQPDLRGLLQPLIDAPNLHGAVIDGGAFWLSRRA